MQLRHSIPLLLTLLAGGVAHAQQPASNREAFFRCTDGSGQAHYADRLPPACAGYDTQVLNERGTVLRVIEGTQSRTARLEREKREAAERQAREDQALRDRVLIESYLTVADIERLRSQRLELLEAQLNVTQQNINSLKERQTRLQQQVARFRPYSDQPNAPPLPDHIAEELVNTVKSMETYQQTLAVKQVEQREVRESFARDIARFKELKGLP